MRAARSLALLALAGLLRSSAHGPVWLASRMAAAATFLEKRAFQ